MPIPIPVLFHEALENSHLLDVDGWWEGLEDADRREAISFWQTVAVGPVRGFRLQAAIVAEEPEAGYWHNDFYEYLVNHEIPWFQENTFHICHATSEGRECLRDGLIPGGFRCPIANANCQMREILRASGGRGVSLRMVPEYQAAELG